MYATLSDNCHVKVGISSHHFMPLSSSLLSSLYFTYLFAYLFIRGRDIETVEGEKKDRKTPSALLHHS